MRAIKAFIKPFEVRQSVKIKISLNFYFNTTFKNARDVKGLQFSYGVFKAVYLTQSFHPGHNYPAVPNCSRGLISEGGLV